MLRVGPATVIAFLMLCLLSACQRGETRAERAVREKILLLGNGTEPRTLDPHIASGVPEHKIIMALLEGLAIDHPTENEVIPGCAERWESNESKDHWTFYLRPTAKWSNGEPLLASDFVFAYQRLLTAEIASEYSEMLYPLIGAEDFHKGKTKDFSTVGVKALSDKVLEMRLVGPTPHFPKMLQHYCWCPVHPATILKHGTMTQRFNPWVRPGNFVGNGAFQLKEWRFKHYIDVERNPHYWGAKDVKLNGVRFFPLDNLTTEERMWRDGQLHITELLPNDKVKWWKANRPDVYREDPELSVYFYRLNTTRPPFNDVRVRQALSLAIDRDTLCKNVGSGGNPPARTLIPPHVGYHGPEMLTFDPEKAKASLAAAGFAQGSGFPEKQILFNTMDMHRTIAEAIQEMWKKHLGVRVSLDNQDWQVYLEHLHRMDYDIARGGWTADYMDPNTFLEMWTTGNGQNETGWSNKEFDALIEQGKREADGEKRFEILKKAEAIFLTEVPAIPIYFRINTRLVHPSVRGWPAKLLDTHPYQFIDLVPASNR